VVCELIQMLRPPSSDLWAASVLAQTTLISDKTAAVSRFVCAWRSDINKLMCLGASPRTLLRWIHHHIAGGQADQLGADPIAPMDP
jgi:hypothetical protein